MEPRILFISTYPELTLIAKQVAQELNIAIHISEGEFLNCAPISVKELESKYDVLISQGGTAAVLNKVVKSIPVLSIPISIGDILKALGQAIGYKKPLALISYRNEELRELEELTKLFNIEYQILDYSNKAEFVTQVDKALRLDGHTLIGMGSCIQDAALENGLNYVIIASSPTSVRQTIISASNIVELNNKEEHRTARFKNIVENSTEGIISIDPNGSITTFNSIAAKILQVDQKAVLNQSIFSSDTPKSIKLIYANGELEINKLMKLDNTTIRFNRIPVKSNYDHEDTIISFHEFHVMQNLEINTRMQLHFKGMVAKNTFDNIIGVSDTLKESIKKATKLARTSATILIEGETGTGKELFAQSIHNASMVRNGPFVAINCATLPENLLETELFGYEEGAFTGAKKSGKIGLFELANNGTIFLDEISEITPSIQSRLLRVLQEKEILKVGGNRIINVNARIIVSTNKNLYNMTTQGLFRNDLFFRISIINLKLEPLRKRKADIPALVEHFIKLGSRKYGANIQTVSPQGIKLLQQFTWPGNIRELEIFMEKLIILADGEIIDEKFIEQVLGEYMESHTEQPKDNLQDKILVDVAPLRDMEMQIIETLLKKYNGNKKQLAKALGISRATIWNKLLGSRQTE